MAHSIQLSAETLQHISNQIGELLGQSKFRFAEAQKLQLAEAFPIWELSAEAVFQPRPWEASIATGYWYVQLRDERKPRGFAKVKVLGPQPTDWQLSAVFESDIAVTLDDSVSMVDERDHAGEARILEIPAWMITALWLADKDYQHRFMILKAVSKAFRPGESYTGEDFFEILRKLPLVTGRLKE